MNDDNVKMDKEKNDSQEPAQALSADRRKFIALIGGLLLLPVIDSDSDLIKKLGISEIAIAKSSKSDAQKAIKDLFHTCRTDNCPQCILAVEVDLHSIYPTIEESLAALAQIVQDVDITTQPKDWITSRDAQCWLDQQDPNYPCKNANVPKALKPYYMIMSYFACIGGMPTPFDLQGFALNQAYNLLLDLIR